MSLFLPLNILEAEIVVSTKSTLYTARGLTARHPLMGIRSDVFKNSITMFMSEVLYRVVKDGVSEPGLYDWCERSILLLDAVQTDFSNFHLRFLLELAVALGFSPESRDLQPFVGENFDVVERLMRGSFAQTMLIPMNGPLRNEIAEQVLRYIEYHTDSTLRINSLKVLRELFA